MRCYSHFLLIICALFGLLLSSCHRATYSFQSNTNTFAAVVAAPPASPKAGSFITPSALVEIPKAVKVGALPQHPQVSQSRLPLKLRLVTFVLKQHIQPAARASQVKAQPPQDPPTRNKIIAILLTLVPLVFPLYGLQRFYLGYHAHGATILGLEGLALLLFLSAIVSLFTGNSAGGSIAFVLAAIIFAGIVIFQITDLIRIIIGDLQPNNGTYR